ncbi:MAG: hypothetical protein GXO79_04155 [Chlorobi bacterium]|nr:hypothetical protein [Chlorobiota bacterium]
MKTKVLFFLLVLLNSGFLFAQEVPKAIILSSKVGPVIDSVENKEYNLFPEIPVNNFKGAQFFKLADGSKKVKIYYKDGTVDEKPFSESDFQAYKLKLRTKQVDYSRIDTSFIYIVKLLDETIIYGKILEVEKDKILITSKYLGTIDLLKSDILKIDQVEMSYHVKGKNWFPNPHDTRHFFAPTARSLKKGEGYVQDIYLLFVSANYGITDNFLIGGGFSMIPGLSIDEQMFFINPKAGFKIHEKFNLGGGILYTKVMNDFSFGIAYGVGTYGTDNDNFTIGMGYGLVDDEWNEKPIFLIGGMTRPWRKIALITENWIIPIETETVAALSYGTRYFGERLCVDFAFIIPVSQEMDRLLFPGIPYIDFVINF